ncbi:hypothetical protein [Thermococcus onnurineus]|uniref:hypothetical protein n=1 Tax=Thermococcus onnurineus TaxID=342948 RepID=UPI0011D0711D|nr:hypothetical protein [Thermococcus onnurineus]
MKLKRESPRLLRSLLKQGKALNSAGVHEEKAYDNFQQERYRSEGVQEAPWKECLLRRTREYIIELTLDVPLGSDIHDRTTLRVKPGKGYLMERSRWRSSCEYIYTFVGNNAFK